MSQLWCSVPKWWFGHCVEIPSHYFKKVSHYNDLNVLFFITLAEMDFHTCLLSLFESRKAKCTWLSTFKTHLIVKMWWLLHGTLSYNIIVVRLDIFEFQRPAEQSISNWWAFKTLAQGQTLVKHHVGFEIFSGRNSGFLVEWNLLLLFKLKKTELSSNCIYSCAIWKVV